MIWTVSQLYGALDVAFARIFAEAPERDIVRRTARGLLVVVLIGARHRRLRGAGLAGRPARRVRCRGEFPVASLLIVGRALGPVPAAADRGVVVLVVYRTLPPTPPRWRSALVPAIVVGIAIVVLTQVFTFLVPRLVGVAALAGSLASAFIALAWLSFTFQALLYGAAWVRVRDESADARPGQTRLGGPAAPAEPGGGGE